MERMHEGILYQDQHKRYCLYKPGVASVQKADLHLKMSTGNLAQSSLDYRACRRRRRRLLVVR